MLFKTTVTLLHSKVPSACSVHLAGLMIAFWMSSVENRTRFAALHPSTRNAAAISFVFNTAGLSD